MPTASIKFVQGALNGGDGEALIEGGTVTGVAVTISNVNNTDANEWTFELVKVPPGSALTPGVKQQSTSLNTYQFTPDVRGGYVWLLRVKSSAGLIAEDYKVFGVKETSGRFRPPYTATDRMLNSATVTTGWRAYVDEYLSAFDVSESGVTDNFPTDADRTAPASAYNAAVVRLTGAGLTAGRNYIWPTAAGKAVVVLNATPQTITVKTAAGTGVAIPATQARTIFSDGTNVVSSGAAGGGSSAPAGSANSLVRLSASGVFADPSGDLAFLTDMGGTNPRIAQAATKTLTLGIGGAVITLDDGSDAITLDSTSYEAKVSGTKRLELFAAGLWVYGNYNWDGTAARELKIDQRGSDVATVSVTIAGQEPFGTATGANRTPGDLILQTGTPSAGGTTYGKLKTKVGGTEGPFVGRDANGIYLGLSPTGLPTSGLLRGPKNATLLATVAAGGSDVNVLKSDNSDTITMGDATTGGNIIITTFSYVALRGGLIYNQISGNDRWTLNANNALNVKPIIGDAAYSSPHGIHGRPSDIAITGNLTLTAAQYAMGTIKLTGTPGAGFNVTFPNPASNGDGYYKPVWNATNATATLVCGTSNTETIVAGELRLVWFGNNECKVHSG